MGTTLTSLAVHAPGSSSLANRTVPRSNSPVGSGSFTGVKW